MTPTIPPSRRVVTADKPQRPYIATFVTCCALLIPVALGFLVISQGLRTSGDGGYGLVYIAIYGGLPWLLCLFVYIGAATRLTAHAFDWAGPRYRELRALALVLLAAPFLLLFLALYVSSLRSKHEAYLNPTVKPILLDHLKAGERVSDLTFHSGSMSTWYNSNGQLTQAEDLSTTSYVTFPRQWRANMVFEMSWRVYDYAQCLDERPQNSPYRITLPVPRYDEPPKFLHIHILPEGQATISFAQDATPVASIPGAPPALNEETKSRAIESTCCSCQRSDADPGHADDVQALKSPPQDTGDTTHP